MAEKQLVKVNEVEGFFHDPEWYKPLLFGKNLYMNVTYLLPGREMVMGSKKEKEDEGDCRQESSLSIWFLSKKCIVICM